MNLPTGEFDAKTISGTDSLIKLKNWVEPAIVNTGNVSITIRGYVLEPGKRLNFGPAGVIMQGEIRISWGTTTTPLGETPVKRAQLFFVNLSKPPR